MKYTLLSAAAAALFLSTSGHTQVQDPIQILGYYTFSTSNAKLQADAPRLDVMGTDLYAIDSSGNITGSMPSAVQQAASANSVDLYPIISNFDTSDFSPTIAHAVLVPGAARTHAIDTMVSLSQQTGITGINLDFEAVDKTDRSLLSSFVSDLAIALHQHSRLLIVSVPATDQNDPNDFWTGAYDYGAIGQSADIVQVMTYDENGPWGPDGPVAGLDWVKASIAYAATEMPLWKINMGIPAYGYDWNLTDGTGEQVDYKAIPGMISSLGATPEWDSASSSPKFYYQTGGKEHVVWYENAHSIKLKAQYAVSKGVGGVSVWSLGQENNGFWTALANGGL
ncbi:glycosyl hydrolase family 18 protein [Sphingosinithalassobacter portus]|uniref:glycosyl hydrolase family 18 protein n=1 Tax=Stakelama portus TaxID=2676234 RepID=UPI0011AB6E8E|nr:glycosyl hydrolase family 18 protein [Sphingosinithalassobacter portus]